MTEVEELRPLTAGRLLTIRREAASEERNEAVLGLLCNAQVLAECCFADGKRVFTDAQAVLDTLTVQEMEALLKRLAEGDGRLSRHANPRFDETRFQSLRGE